ncbi:multiheme c-type cytochrome [Dokdonella sp.]|uniref:multiheme c-type cytochrome n=1 Tax=Dokdonella sp. TaxID=2291710 RepID=UPI0035270453
MNRCSTALIAMLMLALFPAFVIAAPSAVSAIESHKHMGVASCSNSVCHGASQPFRDSNVLQNEFAIWQEFDPHAKAWQTLGSDASKAIARNLGIGDPATAKVCIDCHADSIPESMQGDRFQLSDGVGCESCHGGSELWLNAHADRSVSHADNVKNGLYPTDQPIARARLCLSCHMGTPDRMITHRIMGAGHPRLSFELDTFTWLNPHYKIGEAWVARKGEWNGVRDWAVGQGVASENLLDILTDPKAGWKGIFPELVLFDCHACHKLMSGRKWGPRQGTGLGPGVVRLNDANALMFRHVLAPVDKAAAARILEQTRALHKATTQSQDATLAAARRLRASITELLPAVAAFDYGPDSLDAILASIEADAKRGEYRDYASAEQVAMAAQSVVVAFENDGQINADQAALLRSRLDDLYATIKDENAWSVQRFNTALSALRAAAP